MHFAYPFFDLNKVFFLSRNRSDIKISKKSEKRKYKMAKYTKMRYQIWNHFTNLHKMVNK